MGENVQAINKPIMNYFADRQLAEKVLNDIEKTIKIRYFYCKSCALCMKFRTYRNEFCKKGFWTFHKEIKYWNVYDPDWSYKNTFFKLEPVKAANFRMKIYVR